MCQRLNRAGIIVIETQIILKYLGKIKYYTFGITIGFPNCFIVLPDGYHHYTHLLSGLEAKVHVIFTFKIFGFASKA